MRKLIVILLLFFCNTPTAYSYGIWPLFFKNNNKFSLISPFIQWNDNKTIFRPLFVYEKEENDYRFDFLYPIVSFSKQNKRIFPLFNSRDKDKNHTNFFPFFWGKTKNNKSYGGFFPFYGKLLNRLKYDEVSFLLWPIWSEKRRNNDKDYSLLWPFFGWSKGENYHGFRFWPFFSFKEKKDFFYEKFFLWPFFIFQKRKIDCNLNNFEYKHLYFPFFIHTYSKGYDYKTYLFPFFRFNRNNSGYRYFAFPWPILTYEKEDSSGKFYKFSFFPIYRKIYLKNMHKESFFWILFKNEKTFLKGKKYSSKKSFLLINRFEKNYSNNTTYKNVWPFFEYASSKNSYVFKLFELFPFKIKPFYELYSPFFNIFYIAKNENKKRINFLWGLFVYEKNDNCTTLKFFQFLKLKFKHEKKFNYSYNFYTGL